LLCVLFTIEVLFCSLAVLDLTWYKKMLNTVDIYFSPYNPNFQEMKQTFAIYTVIHN